MKKINIVLLIMMMPCLLMQAAQESKSGYDSDTQSVQSFKRRKLDSGVDVNLIEEDWSNFIM